MTTMSTTKAMDHVAVYANDNDAAESDLDTAIAATWDGAARLYREEAVRVAVLLEIALRSSVRDTDHAAILDRRRLQTQTCEQVHAAIAECETSLCLMPDVAAAALSEIHELGQIQAAPGDAEYAAARFRSLMGGGAS